MMGTLVGARCCVPAAGSWDDDMPTRNEHERRWGTVSSRWVALAGVFGHAAACPYISVVQSDLPAVLCVATVSCIR